MEYLPLHNAVDRLVNGLTNLASWPKTELSDNAYCEVCRLLLFAKDVKELIK